MTLTRWHLYHLVKSDNGEWESFSQSHYFPQVIKLAREAKEVKEVISSNLTTSAPTKKREAIQNFLEIKGAKGKYFVLRSTVNYLIRDPNISKRHDIVDQYKPEFRDRNHRYFLRNTEQECTTKAHVDHILECQFLSHCIMQTECLHPVIKNIEISSCMGKQLSVVQNVLKPLYKIHNGQDQIASYFNLQLMDGNLNILKGEAVTDFIFRQYSTVPGFKKGPIDFVSHFKNSKLVRDGIIDADTLAGEVENTLQCFPLFFLFSLHPSLSLFFYPSLSSSFLPSSFSFHHHHSHAFLYSLHTAPDHNNDLFPFFLFVFLSYFLSSLMLFFSTSLRWSGEHDEICRKPVSFLFRELEYGWGNG